ncbi:MAG: condensation domain-containing protein [Prosthecobacter sp.]|uniref:condensation domain-containing protein n=1 Tax=Prosthecobacter sp. TaxID=1965333 RepID=UPI0039011CD8
MSQDNRARLKQWLASGEIRLQPLSFPQRELWEASPMPAADVSNNICALIQVRGLLTPQGSEAALQKVVDRQEVLRLSILPGKDQPMQMIRKTGTPALRFHELPSAQRQPEAIEELTREISSQPFDLVQGPLYRAEVFRRSADDHVLVLVIHHAIADGWTLGVFVQDLFASYMQGVRGNHAALPPVPLTYSQWGAAERAFWQPAELEPRAAFWKMHLAGAPRLWNKPASGTLQRCVTQVSAELGRAVRELARRNGATLFSTLLTAFQITLSKWTGADDIVVGTPVANRSTQAVRETMGYCSGIVPLRGQIDRTRSFAESLRTVHQTTVESFANAMPFAELVRVLGEPTSSAHNPLFEVRFALQNHPIPDVAVPGLSLQLRMRCTGTARFNLACEINEEGDAMEVAWLFRENQFSLEDIQNVGRLYLAVLAGVCRSPEILTAALMTTLR